MLERLCNKARSNARPDATGWARFGDIFVAYYPRCGRFAYFLRYGICNRSDVEAFIERNERLPRLMA